MGISKVSNSNSDSNSDSDSNSNSNFNTDLEDNNGLYYRRIYIDNKWDPKKGNFRDNKQVDIACKLYSWKINYLKGKHKLKDIDGLNV